MNVPNRNAYRPFSFALLFPPLARLSVADPERMGLVMEVAVVVTWGGSGMVEGAV